MVHGVARNRGVPANRGKKREREGSIYYYPGANPVRMNKEARTDIAERGSENCCVSGKSISNAGRYVKIKMYRTK